MPRRARRFTPEPTVEPDYSDPRTILALAKLEQARRNADAKYHTDPWRFLTEAVQTIDQIDGQTKKIPRYKYLEFLTTLWMSEPLLAVAKSRRMMVTWLFVSLNYWLCRYRPGVKVGFFARKQGEKETEGSNELVWRAHYVHTHLPDLLTPRPDYEYTTGRLVFHDTHSEILALAQGSDQARQYTFTSVLADEMGFWEQALETYVALRPTAEGGGKITCVSSANPGFFETLVYDQMPGRTIE